MGGFPTVVRTWPPWCRPADPRRISSGLWHKDSPNDTNLAALSYMSFLIRRVISAIHKIRGLVAPRAHSGPCGTVCREQTQIMNA
eukprot:1724841-Pyramimonas_sp.AAC.1